MRRDERAVRADAERERRAAERMGELTGMADEWGREEEEHHQQWLREMARRGIRPKTAGLPPETEGEEDWLVAALKASIEKFKKEDGR